jgi:hypothetical protein
MGNIAFGLVFLIMGLVFVIFNKFVTKWHIEIQSSIGFRFSERDRVITRIIYFLGGIFFAANGALILLAALSLI